MKFIFIGTGSAFTVGTNFQSNMYFEADSGKRLLVDCGSDVRHGLHELGLDQNSIDAVYISHLHADHIGGLEWLAFKTMFDPDKPRKLDLYCNEALVEGLWNILSGGLSSLEDHKAGLASYFNVHLIESSEYFLWEEVQFHLFETIHVFSAHELMPSYGLKAVIDGVKMVLTTDTRFPFDEKDPLRDLYKWADIIFHDCETSAGKSGVHAHYTELVTLSPEFKKKMWLYHYQPGDLPNAQKDGFRGFVQKGQCFDFNLDTL